jgi:hypothetical protein
VGAELSRNAEKYVLREWETCPVGVLIVDSFGAFEDFVDEGEFDFRKLVFDMVVFDCAEVTFSSFGFDRFDEVREPGGD